MDAEWKKSNIFYYGRYRADKKLKKFGDGTVYAMRLWANEFFFAFGCQGLQRKRITFLKHVF